MTYTSDPLAQFLPYAAVVLSAILALFLSTFILFRRGFGGWLKSKKMVFNLSILTAGLGLGVGAVTTLFSPRPVFRALAICSDPSPFPPFRIRCVSKSSAADEVEWRYENGNVLRGQDTIERAILEPGNYRIKLTIKSERILQGMRTSDYDVAFTVFPKPDVPPRELIVTRILVGESAGEEVKTFRVLGETGYQINRMELRIEQSVGAEIISQRISGTEAEITAKLTSRQVFRGFSWVTEPAFFKGEATLILVKSDQ